MIGNLKNEILFQNMFHLTTEGVLVVNNHGTILMANPTCKKLFDYNPDSLLGKNIEILITEKYREQLKNYLSNIENSTFGKDIDVFGIKKNGIEFSLEIRLNSTEINDKIVIIVFFRDTSNRYENLQEIKQVNNKLIESNHKFDTLINNAKGILFRCKNNRDYNMEYISKGCLEITGYPFEDFKDGSVTYGQLILEEDRNSVWDQIQISIKQKKPYNLEYRLEHKDGNVKYVWEKGEAVCNNQDKVIALEGFITDVTEQNEQNLKIKALLEAMPDMMFIQDRNGDYTDWYANSSEKLFMPPEKFIGQNMKNVLPDYVYKIVKESHKNAIASGNMQITEYSVKTEKGIDYYEARITLMNDHKLLTIVRDITAKKAQEKELLIKDRALASANNSIIIVDLIAPNTPIIYCNEAFEKMTGYTNKDVIGKNYKILKSHKDDKKENDILDNAILNGKPCNAELRTHRKDGTIFCSQINIMPLYNKNNTLTHFIGVQSDVTKKAKEAQLKNQTQKILELIAKDKPLKTIIKEIIDITETHIKDAVASILLLNKEDKILHVLAAPNLPKAFCNFIDGISIGPKTGSCGTAAFIQKEVIVSNIATNVLWEDYKDMALKNGLKACWAFPIMSYTNQVLGILSIYSKFARPPLAFEKEVLLDMTYLASIAIEKHKNIIVLQESKKQLEDYAQNLENKVQERTQEVMATVQKLVESNLNLEDQILITKQAEDAAIASKALSAAIAKNFPKGFILIVNKDLHLVLAEGEVLTQLGLKSLIFEGMTLDDISFFAEERKTKIKADIEKTFSGKHLSFEIQYKNRYFSVNTTPLFEENNQIIYALMVYNDISEQKEIEFSIQSALRKEQELNELKLRFISMASHEFRTPLSAILTSAVLIGKQNELGKEGKREKYVAQIEKNVKHLVTILNDFLSLSKLEEGKIRAVKERFDVIHYSKTLVKESNIGLKKAQYISLSTSIEKLFVNLDGKLLRHAITNLLSNASKYSAENTTIDFKIAQSEHKVLIQIKDRGIGIPQEEQEQLFNRFYRAKNANNIEGTGLGLNIAKYYTELMGGTIGFVSKLNVGTTFWIELPIDNK